MSSDIDGGKDDDRLVRFRIDFVFEVISTDDESRTVRFIARPDPRRYEWRTEKGERYLYDKFDDLRFPEDILKKFAEDLKGHPINYEPQKIGDAVAYVRSRRPLILSFLKGDQSPPTFADPSDDFLASLETDKLEFVILSLDLVGSTKLATSVPVADYSRLIQTALFEISEIVPYSMGMFLSTPVTESSPIFPHRVLSRRTISRWIVLLRYDAWSKTVLIPFLSKRDISLSALASA